MLKFAEKSW